MLKLKGDVKHERSTRGAAPTFDAATCEGRRCPCKGLCCHASSRVMPRGFFFLANLRRLAPTQADSRLIRPTQAEMVDSSRNSKKTKRCKMDCLNLILNPTLAHFTHTHQTSALWLSLSPSLVSHSLCALCLCLCSLWNTQPVPSQSLDSLQFILSSALSHAFLTQVLI